MLKQLYNKISLKNIFNKNLIIRSPCSALASQQHTVTDETIDGSYEIEILHKNIHLLQSPAENIICPVCFGNGYISCPNCKVGCRDCNSIGYIDCPLCNKSKL
tara:strand:- start:1330 stop:1638 length:309 start_codon:yes stop_codon:yes gene_type:complete